MLLVQEPAPPNTRENRQYNRAIEFRLEVARGGGRGRDGGDDGHAFADAAGGIGHGADDTGGWGDESDELGDCDACEDTDEEFGFESAGHAGSAEN